MPVLQHVFQRSRAVIEVSCPVRKQDWAGDLQVFLRQAACAYWLIGPPRTGLRRICCVSMPVTVARGASGSPSGDALGDALVRPGRVVVRLVFSQDRLQMSLAGDSHAVQELATQGSDEALADRVGSHRRLHPVQMIGTGVSG